MVIIKQDQMEAGVSAEPGRKRWVLLPPPRTERRRLAVTHPQQVSPARDARKHLVRTPDTPHQPHPSSFHHSSPPLSSFLFSLSLPLSLNVYEPLGTVYKKFIGSLRRGASLMLNVETPPTTTTTAAAATTSSWAMTPSASHVFFEQNVWRSRGREAE